MMSAIAWPDVLLLRADLLVNEGLGALLRPPRWVQAAGKMEWISGTTTS